jgi:hypothetical protein
VGIRHTCLYNDSANFDFIDAVVVGGIIGIAYPFEFILCRFNSPHFLAGLWCCESQFFLSTRMLWRHAEHSRFPSEPLRVAKV